MSLHLYTPIQVGKQVRPTSHLVCWRCSFLGPIELVCYKLGVRYREKPVYYFIVE